MEFPQVDNHFYIYINQFDNITNHAENQTRVYDFSGYDNNATCSASTCPTYNETSGKFAGAFEFDAVDDYLEASDSSTLDLAGNLSIEASVYPNSISSGMLVSKGGNYFIRI